MRCPKCHYLGFDPEPRCKNCGYDLEVADADLALRASEPLNDADEEAVADLTLHERPAKSRSPVTLALNASGTDTDVAPQWEPEPEPQWDPVAEPAPEPAPAPRLSLLQSETRRKRPRSAARKSSAGAAVVEPPARFEEPSARLEELPARFEELPARIGPPALVVDLPARIEPAASVVQAPVSRTPFRSPHTTADLPLFVKGIAANEPLPDDDDLRRPAAPVRLPPAGPPLAVRRAAPEPIRSRPPAPERRTGSLDHDLLEDVRRVEREEAAFARNDAGLLVRDAVEADDVVRPLHRVAAAAIDVGVLGGIATFVFWATLRLCNVSISALGLSSLLPLLIFLVMMDVGYLLMFTAAGGQTVGKMLMHIRVVDSDTADGEGVSVGRAASRAVLTVVSLGVGWLPALFGRGTLHDRVAHTRVVRA